MSLFPYNNHKHAGYGSQGSPLDFAKARELAYDLFWWHSQIAETDAWTQSREAAEHEIDEIALGLMTVFAEPSHVQMLGDIGESVQRRLNTLNTLRERTGDREQDAGLGPLGLIPQASR